MVIRHKTREKRQEAGIFWLGTFYLDLKVSAWLLLSVLVNSRPLDSLSGATGRDQPPAPSWEVRTLSWGHKFNQWPHVKKTRRKTSSCTPTSLLEFVESLLTSVRGSTPVAITTCACFQHASFLGNGLRGTLERFARPDPCGDTVGQCG